MDRIVVAFANEESQRRIARLLESDGVSPAGCFFSGADAIRAIRQLGGGIVVCGFKLRDMTAQDLAASLQDLATLLVVSSAANLDFCEGENLFKLATPAARSDFFASLDLLRQASDEELSDKLAISDSRIADLRSAINFLAPVAEPEPRAAEEDTAGAGNSGNAQDGDED